MNLEIFAIYDRVAEAYSQPFFTHNENIAMREFGKWVNTPDTQYYNHPNDYSLYHLGNFDDNTAAFEIKAEPTRIAVAMDLKSVVETSELFPQ